MAKKERKFFATHGRLNFSYLPIKSRLHNESLERAEINLMKPF